MRLKRLELYGFKSFATRTVFEFQDGIAAIIGPNGSGKSNVADAVRWVMGEQSYSNLRAKGTEDMIFAGAGARQRMGMAEVLITLDNSAGEIPLDYSEVVVGRRAFRSGENEYLLNGSQVRYRDVLDILSGAGLARSRYTVVSQGLVDAALSLRPEARRGLFEEAAGVSAHLRKRDEALKRIEETERNLERVRDIVQELAPRAKTLRRQAERAEEHNLLRRDLEELQRIWYGYQWQRRQARVLDAEATLREQTALVEAQRARGGTFQEAIARLDGEHARHAERLDETNRRLAALHDEAEACAREVAVGRERQRLLEQQAAGLAGEERELASRREVLAREVARAREELGEHQEAERAAQTQAVEARQRLAALDASRKALQRSLAEVEARLNQLGGLLSSRRARLEQLGEHEEQLIAERGRSEEAAARLEERLAGLRASLTSLEAAAAQATAARQDVRERLAALEAESADGRRRIAEAEAALAAVERRHGALTSRLELLTRLRQEMTGYHPGVRAVLAAGAGLRGLLGTVVNLMTVPARLEEAIESALGGRLQNVVAETWEDAAAAIDHLKRTRGGWATFLPLDTLRSRPAMRLSPGRGVVGVASELVQYEARLRPLFEMLLGQVVIVEDLPTARRLLGERTNASLIVTLEGETVQPTGALSGGTRQRSSNLVAQEREWQALPEQIAAAEAERRDAEARLAEARAALAELRRQGEELEREGRRLQADAEAAARAVTARTGDLREAEREAGWHASRLAQTARELAELVTRQDQIRGELATGEREREEALARARELREQAAASDDEALRRQVAELETRAAVARRTAQSQERLLASHSANLAALEGQRADKAAQATRLQADITALAKRMEEVEARQVDIATREAALRAALEPEREALAAVEARRREVDEERARYVERLHEAELAASRAALERDRARDDLIALGEDIEANLGPIELPDDATHQLRLTLGDDVLELPRVDSIPAGLGDQIRQLRVRLRRLGNVNPDAPREYEELLDRQTFLEGQESDLRGAIASLHEVIEELDNVIERDFVDTVKAVDRAFGDYFQRLFEGGSAKLVLTDPDNPSTTGVEVIVRPPGKRTQNLSLLSGGERALTAVALLFALLKANPVPFCCLDEVDAALDEANVQRFRALLTEHARTTQFVVITHNRRTIEAASTVYGISMGERGVSQCISLRLDGSNGNGRQAESLADAGEPEGSAGNGDGPSEPEDPAGNGDGPDG